MITAVKLENFPALRRKKFCTDEIYQMMEAGILPEESGWELIDGEIIDRMSIGSKHAGTVKRLNKILTNSVGNRAIVSVQDPIHIDNHNEPEPDIALLKPREDFYAENHPLPEDILLLIEVSASTINYDRDIKKTLYAEAEVFEFWLVNLAESTIECYSSPKNGYYRLAKIVGIGETVQSILLENLTLKVDELLGL